VSAVRVDVVTLFPEMFGGFLATSFVGRAIEGGQLAVRTRSPRDFGLGKHRSVDDTPYGGGSGMVMRVDVLVAAMESLDADAPAGLHAHRVLLTPQGRRLDQGKVRELAARDAVMLVCGRYEGFDERIRGHVNEELSLGDFVMTGGEVAAMAVVDGCARLLPGVLGNEASTIDESHSPETGGLLEYPHYTRPVEFRGARVPDVLAGGNHAEIARWRRQQAVARTQERRPDLWERFQRETAGEADPGEPRGPKA
jgi:tRNA (guanine37-N1)-methyltransferase